MMNAERGRLKAKALGDIRNTLYSRPANYLNQTPAKQINSISNPTNSSKPTTKNVLSTKKKEKRDTPIATENKTVLSTPDVDGYGLFEFHSHDQCGKGNSFLSNYLSTYRLSEMEIQNIVHGVRNFQKPLSVNAWEPCEDIKLSKKEVKDKENIFSVDDILSDVILPEIAPP